MGDQKLFLSYSSKDKDFQDRLRGSIDELGISSWRDLNDLRGGVKWWPAIKEAIASCDVFVLTLSSNAMGSEWVEKEIAEAVQQDKHIIPLHISDSDIAVPEHLKEMHWIKQFQKDFSEGMLHLLNALRAEGIRSRRPLPERYLNYLEYTLNEMSSWKQRYTPLFAKFEQFTIFATVQSSLASGEPVELLDIVPKHRQLVILGAAGSGKTTTLQKLAQSTAEAALKNLDDELIPINIPLRNYGTHNLAALIDSRLGPWGIDFQDLEADLDSGRFLFLLDGLNEITVGEREAAYKEIREFIERYPRNRFVITSRSVGYDDTHLATVEKPITACEIQALRRRQIKEYIERYFLSDEQSAQSLLDELQLQDDCCLG